MKKKSMYNNAINLYIKLLKIYFNDYNNIRNEKKEDMGKKYEPSNLLFVRYKFIESEKQNENKKKKNHFQKKLLLKE